MAVGASGAIHYIRTTRNEAEHFKKNRTHLENGAYVNGKKLSPNSQAIAPGKLGIAGSPLDWVIRPTMMSESTGPVPASELTRGIVS